MQGLQGTRLDRRAPQTMNIPNKKRRRPGFIAVTASGNEICPVTRSAIAPPSIICQILSLYLPTCRIVISRKTLGKNDDCEIRTRDLFRLLEMRWYLFR